MTSPRGAVLGALAVLCFAACGGSPGGQPGDGGLGDGTGDGPGQAIAGLQSLTVTPADATLMVGDQPATQRYQVQGRFTDGHQEDVTDRVAFSLSVPALGTFQGALFTSTTQQGGRTEVQARAGSVSGTASLTLVLKRQLPIPPGSGGPALPPDPGTKFGGPADASRAPTLVYPNDGVVLPPNLGRIEVHWLRGPAQNTLFELGFKNSVTDVRLYVRCERPDGVQDDGCIVEPTGEAWTFIAETNRGGEALQLTVRATDDQGSAVGTSATQSLSFAKDDISGTIYYWTTSQGGLIQRFDFGSTATTAETVLGPDVVTTTEEGARCVGCHALSRDGKKIAASVGGQNHGGFLLFDLETGMALRNASGMDDHIVQFSSFAPDGNQLAVVFGDDTSLPDYKNIQLFDTRCDAASMGTCGQKVGVIDMGGLEADHPDWASDGQAIAFTSVGDHQTSQRPRHGSIAWVQKQGDTWGPPGELVPAADGVNRFNPHFSPDASFLVFSESTCPGGNIDDKDCDGDTDPTATIHALPLPASSPVVLARAQAPGLMDQGQTALANTFPRFAPFVFVLTAAGERGGVRHVNWVTFSTTRRYGLRTPPANASGDENPSSTWLWMSAVEPENLQDGQDPSYPAFALPFQDLTTSNHIAVWTERKVGKPIGRPQG
jgi:hypothetical protein